ncbi:membrane-bound dehydrogenase domain-containing protein [Rhodopirellula maiorica SM1]|uniref:Membrane-bound dehydrogenase domain-containing protein n=1 Tax=Rhodopirellula maiorica SM1 TaxID=1265738 RepID=M5RJB2_9BACT|nr:PVC-type heme-binding CxxCH protein [Rhodopirellula maiorica]EMI19403.1 membrane-bound dehydrogenase domain-containing protein [Rhodopirellula maiorica SM1]
MVVVRHMFIATLLLTSAPAVLATDPVGVDWETQRLSSEFFSEGATSGDFNRDGAPDIASGPFWYAGPDFKTSHRFYAQDAFDPHGYSNNFFAYTDDFNGDGWDDVLVFGFPGKDASWFENPRGADRFWPRHQVLDRVDNESPTFVDITGDGKREIVCSQDGYFGFAEINSESPESPWQFRRLSTNVAGGKFTHGLGIGDIDGDGRLDVIEKNGWWKQPDSLEGDPSWQQHSFAFSPGTGGAQMFVSDVDGDGDNDVITSINAHGFGLVWYEQIKADQKITFKSHRIMGATPAENPYGVCFSQIHSVELVDINGDGLDDILTGKRHWAHGPRGDANPNDPAVVYWFELSRSAAAEDTNKDSVESRIQWIPHLIDDDSGVGTEVNFADLDADGDLDVFVGNKKGTFVHRQLRHPAADAAASNDAPRPRRLDARPATSGLPENEGLSPQQAAQAITVPEGFRVQLAAGEPMVHQPIAMTLDDRGRLWIAEAYTYPTRAPMGEGKDKIIILEDDDHDGVFDSRTVFAEGLNLVSGLEVGFGGVWVGAAPYLMFIPDHDGDDVPDGEPEILLDGFGYQDTHETLNAFIWGPDGWLYGCHGVFTHSKVGRPGTADADRTPLNAGVWRYHPVRHTFEVFAHGTSNPWGVDFNEYGQSFITACVIPHMYHIIQGGRYQRQAGRHFDPYVYDDLKTIADHAHYVGRIGDHAWWGGRNEASAHHDTSAAGGGHAHCGAMIYLGDNWPMQYRGSMLMANIHGNRINNDLLRRSGSGYVASHGADFLFANDRWFRAINMKYGPDGSVYLIDWYDKNACHRTDREVWDRTNGRVFRIRFGSTESKSVNLSSEDNETLVAYHTHDNEWFSRMARRILQSRCFALGTRTPLDARQKEQLAVSLEALAFGPHEVPVRLRAVWTLHACGLLTMQHIERLLDDQSHKSEYLRAWAIQLEMEDSNTSLLQKLAKMAAMESSAHVRLALASSLQRLPNRDRWPILSGLLRHADDAADANLPLMLWYAAQPLVLEDTPRALALAKQSRLPIVRQFIYRRAATDPAAINHLLTELATLDDIETQKMVLTEITAAIANQTRLNMPKQWPAVYEKLAASGDRQIASQLQMITVKFGDASVFPQLRDIVTNTQLDANARSSALAALLQGKDKQLLPILVSLLDDKRLRGQSIRGLANYGDREGAKAIIERYGRFTSDEKSDAIATLASRVTFAAELLASVSEGKIPRGDLSAFTIRQIQSLGDDSLTQRVNEVWGTARTSPAEKLEQIARLKQQLTSEVLSKADLSHGRVLFNETCGKCHRLFGSGSDIGPDITGSNRADIDYSLQNIIDPNALIGRDYQATQVLTSDGRVITGLLKDESQTALVIQTANEKVVVDTAEIEERMLAKTSMMPEGQLDPMSADEVRDLIAYLASPVQVPLPGSVPVIDPKTNRVSGVVEAEVLTSWTVTHGRVQPQNMRGFKAGRWSDGTHLWWTGGKPGDKLVLSVDIEKAGTYEVFVAMTKAHDYGIVQFSINDSQASSPIDLFHKTDVVATGPVSLGTHLLDQGANKIQIELTGANPAATQAFMFGLDYIYIK